MKYKKIHPVARKLIDMAANGAGCAIQYNSCPCNTCFHSWAETELDLSPELAHMFWLVVLALRGDYSQDELIENNHSNFLTYAIRGLEKERKGRRIIKKIKRKK